MLILCTTRARNAPHSCFRDCSVDPLDKSYKFAGNRHGLCYGSPMRTSLRVSSTSEAGLLALQCLDDSSNSCFENLILIPVLQEDLFLFWRRLSSGDRCLENRATLSTTLGIRVIMAFTLCLVPAVIVIIVPYR